MEVFAFVTRQVVSSQSFLVSVPQQSPLSPRHITSAQQACLEMRNSWPKCCWLLVLDWEQHLVYCGVSGMNQTLLSRH